MADSNGHKEPQTSAQDNAEPAKDKEPVVSKPYVMPDDPEEGSVEALTKDVADAKASQGEADAFALSVLKASLGGVDLTADWGAQLFDAYKDSATHPKGSPAFLAALGLK